MDLLGADAIFLLHRSPTIFSRGDRCTCITTPRDFSVSKMIPRVECKFQKLRELFEDSCEPGLTSTHRRITSACFESELAWRNFSFLSLIDRLLLWKNREPVRDLNGSRTSSPSTCMSKVPVLYKRTVYSCF